jgi:hypothetical protein
MKLLAEELQVAAAFVPVNLAGGANDGDWVSLKNYRHVSVLFFGAAGNATEPATITLEQATTVAGSNAKALNFTRIDKKHTADLFTVGEFTKVTQAAANTYALGTTMGDKQAIVLIDFNAEDLDVEGGFDCIRGRVADVGTVAQIGAMLYILSDPRYTPPPSAIAD